MRRTVAIMCAGLMGFSVASTLAIQPTDGIIRKGEGSLRQELTKLELKPFDATLWGTLSDWKNGSAISGATIAGKPVLVVLWTDYVPTSKRAFALARRLAEKFGPQGLVVVGVHSKNDWQNAQKPEAPKDATLLLALDAQDQFRTGLHSAGDPDFFVIDRAGQMRFASVASESVEAAVELVTKETREAAAGINATLDAAAKATDAAQRKSEANRSNVDLTRLPEVEFELPAAEVYANRALWPAKPRTDGNNSNQEDPPVKMTIPDAGYLGGVKPATKGRVVVLYYWGLEARQSFESIDRMELLQRQHGRDVAVVGVLSPISENNQNGGQGQQENDPKKLEQKVRGFLASRTLQHAILLDPNGGLFAQGLPQRNISTDKTLYPLVSVISTDGTLRTWGVLEEPAVRAGLDKVIQNDPGVAARRKAEDAYIRAHDGK